MATTPKKPKKAPTTTWKCPACGAEVEHAGNVTSHSHGCPKAGFTVPLEPVR